MQPGYRTLARARRSDALETLFADETVSTTPPPPPAPQAARPEPPRPVGDLDLKLFAEEPAWQPKRSRRTRSFALPGSPYLVAVLVALLTVASPFFLSNHAELERANAVTAVAQQTSATSASATELPVASTTEPIVEPTAPRSVEPIAAPTSPVAVASPPVKREAAKAPPTKRQVPPAPPARESRRAPLDNIPSRSLAALSATAAPPPESAVIPALQPAPRAVETLGTLPVSLVSPPAPAPPPAAEARPRALVPEVVDERAAVLATLRRYEAAYSALDARAVRTEWPTVNQAALSRAFESLAEQNIRLGNCAVTVRAPTARATCHGTATWVPRIGGGKAREDRRTWTFSLAQRDQLWSIVSAEMR